MKYKLRLRVTRVKDVTIEAKNQSEADNKAYDMTKDGLDGKGVIEVRCVEHRKDTLRVPRHMVHRIENGVIKL